jgi:hypothetical protein
MADLHQSILLPRSMSREGAIARIGKVLAALPMDKAWRIEIHEQKAKRSLSQNRLLWSLYQQVIDKGGEAMAGWRKEEVHDFFLGEWAGWDRVEVFGRVKLRPLRRSSALNKQDFADFIDFIVTFMADRGVWLDMPEECAA